MNILVNILHPAHYHLFKQAISTLRARGNEVIICARDKDITLELLQKESVAFHLLGVHRGGMAGRLKFAWKAVRQLRLLIKSHSIDFVIGVSDMYGGLASRFSHATAISFTDTDHATLNNWLTRLVTDWMVTPACCTSDFGAKQIRYDGYHELAYLHPDYFTPDPSVRKELGLQPGERLVLLRFVSWEATHDAGHEGISLNYWRDLIMALSPRYRVIISSERELPAEFEKYRYHVSPARMHHVLALADLFIGEGATMASECAVLGTPAIYVNSLAVAYCTEQEEKYGLVFNFRNSQGVREKALQVLAEGGPKEMWQSRRRRLLKEKIDVTAFIVSLVERLSSTPDREEAHRFCDEIEAEDRDSFVAVS